MISRFWFAAALFAAFAVFSGCSDRPAASGGEAAAGTESTAPEAVRPAFLVYETTGRQLMSNELGKEQEITVEQRILAGSQGLRTEPRGANAGGPVAILRLDRKVLWQLDDSKKTYLQVTFGEVAQSVQEVRDLLARSLKEDKLAPERRRALETAFGMRQPKVEVKVDPKTVELLGHKCRHVSYYEDGELRIEEWAAEDLVIPCDMSEVRALTGDFSPGLLKELKGRRSFALKSRIYGRLPMPNIPRVSQIEVTKLETPEKLDASLFEVPPGYKPAQPAARQ